MCISPLCSNLYQFTAPLAHTNYYLYLPKEVYVWGFHHLQLLFSFRYDMNQIIKGMSYLWISEWIWYRNEMEQRKRKLGRTIYVVVLRPRSFIIIEFSHERSNISYQELSFRIPHCSFIRFFDDDLQKKFIQTFFRTSTYGNIHSDWRWFELYIDIYVIYMGSSSLCFLMQYWGHRSGKIRFVLNKMSPLPILLQKVFWSSGKKETSLKLKIYTTI